jgi:AcrR family transcriptional regulator
MPREYDSQATRARILEAATGEFTEHGLAGGRVDRIAERAGANKQSIYAHFGSKERLFAAVVAQKKGELATLLPLDAEDVGSYVSRLFDYHARHPEVLRLLLWEGLQYGADPVPDEAERARRDYAGRVEALAAAQRAGRISRGVEPEVLALLLIGLASWPLAVPQVTRMLVGGEGDGALERVRKAAVEAARLVTSPESDTPAAGS